MVLYEHVFLARQDLSQQQVDELVDQYKGVLEANGGSVGKVESWGLKSLAYRINKNRKAHFTLMNVTAPGPAIKELERQQRLSEDVLRYVTIRVDEHEEGQSAFLARRDDRGGRGDRDRGDRGRGGDRDRGDRGDRDRGDRTERPAPRESE